MLWPALTNLFLPRLDWLQVEVTTHCQAACSYCPHTVYREDWTSRHLDLDTFWSLLPVLKRAGLVHLQGWGEPFLHPDFFTMVSLARQAGCQVGTTTNGMLLDSDSLTRLVDLEVAVVAFSLAGVWDSNDAVRRGTRFATVLENLVALKEIKARKGTPLPRVHVAYMALYSGLGDLALLPRALAGLGVGQVVVSTLDFVASPGLARESLRLLPPEEFALAASRLMELAEQGRRQGLEIHLPFFPADPAGPLCTENAARALCVAADGSLSPCVFLNLPVGDDLCVTRGGLRPYRRVEFGKLNRNRSFLSIWRHPDYRAFRWQWAGGSPRPPACRDCLKPSPESV
jgi:MoaA/NifB/PqqE/SkfB family radical SAM enzyme